MTQINVYGLYFPIPNLLNANDFCFSGNFPAPQVFPSPIIRYSKVNPILKEKSLSTSAAVNPFYLSVKRPLQGVCVLIFPRNTSKISHIPKNCFLDVPLKELRNCPPESTLIPSSFEQFAQVSHVPFNKNVKLPFPPKPLRGSQLSVIMKFLIVYIRM